jgi:hypothetical protein
MTPRTADLTGLHHGKIIIMRAHAEINPAHRLSVSVFSNAMASAGLLLLLVLVQRCFANPGGPPVSVCQDLRPRHPGAPSTGTGGFVVDTDIPRDGGGGGFRYTAGTTYEGEFAVLTAFIWLLSCVVEAIYSEFQVAPTHSSEAM